MSSWIERSDSEIADNPRPYNTLIPIRVSPPSPQMNSDRIQILRLVIAYVNPRTRQFMRSTSSVINQVVLEVRYVVSSPPERRTHDSVSNGGRSLPSLSTLPLAPPSGVSPCIPVFILVATITKTKSVRDLCVVIEAGYLSELVTLDLQCPYSSPASSADSRITDRNVRLLCEALQSGNCSKLHTLRLSNNAMSVGGCGSLATCLSLGCMQELRSLDLQRIDLPFHSPRQPALRRRRQQAR